MSFGNIIIHAKNVKKEYGDGQTHIHALSCVNLSIRKGEIMAVMGPSGSGKTTLLNCISGMDTLSGGEVYMENIKVHHLKDKERDQMRLIEMGFVFQLYNLIPILSAVENVEMPLLCQKLRPKEARTRAFEALSKVGLRERGHHLPSQLSSGQQQRVALARAIVNNPKIVWADEPTGALDRTTSKLVLDLIEHLNRVNGITFVIVTHDPEVAERAHRVIYMDSGMILDPSTGSLDEGGS